MSSLGTTLLAAAVAIGLSAPAFAQSKMDAGGQRGRVDQRRRHRADFGRDAEDGFDRRRQLQYRDAERRKQRGRHPRAEVDRRLATSHTNNKEAVSFALAEKITPPGTIRRRFRSFGPCVTFAPSPGRVSLPRCVCLSGTLAGLFLWGFPRDGAAIACRSARKN